MEAKPVPKTWNFESLELLMSKPAETGALKPETDTKPKAQNPALNPNAEPKPPTIRHPKAPTPQSLNLDPHIVRKHVGKPTSSTPRFGKP